MAFQDVNALIKSWHMEDLDLRKSHNLHGIFDSLWSSALNRQRNAYNVENPEAVIYIPINRLRTVYQTPQATNWDKVQENVERMTRGENLEPVVIGYDYDIHDGHHRFEASHLMNYTHVPCVVGGANDFDVIRAEERYRELWKGFDLSKSFDESKHPRDKQGRFTKVYHATKDKNFKYDPNYHNSQQEMGRGLYTAPSADVSYWHRAMADPSTGDRHPYIVPMDISRAKLIHWNDFPNDRELANHFIKRYGSGDKAIQALDKEEKEFITGETFGTRPFEIAQRRLYAKDHGYDGIIMHDSKEGHQIMLFDDSKVKYEQPLTADEFFKKHRWGEI